MKLCAILGVEPDGLVVVRQRVVEVALALIGEAAVAERRPVGGIEPDGLVVVGQRMLEVALAGHRRCRGC